MQLTHALPLSSPSQKWIWLATTSLVGDWLYIVIVFFPPHLREPWTYLIWPVVAMSIPGIFWLVQWLATRQFLSITRVKDITLASSVSLMCFITADLSYSVYLNAATLSDPDNASLEYYRWSDPNLWVAEFDPRRFYPTARNFQLHKPNVTGSADLYGGSYAGKLTKSLPLEENVLTRTHVSFSIDRYGFRETTPIEQAHIFALGDSFTFGHAVDQKDTWVKQLEHASGIPIYNLGVNGAGPLQELMLLEHLLETHGHSFKIHHLLWMIYEGNDLEDSYETLRPIPGDQKSVFSRLIAGTILEGLLAIPYEIRHEAVVQKYREGTDQATPNFPPLCRSSTHGSMFLPAMVLASANQSRSYITDHPNRPHLERVFKDMALMRMKFDFKVTVVLAPTIYRLYGPYFDRCAPMTHEPYLIDYVANLSHSVGFDTINLYTALQPYTKEELLYFRDDSHWNERGHELVAQIIQRHIRLEQVWPHCLIGTDTLQMG